MRCAPQPVIKYPRRFAGFDKKIVSMDARGQALISTMPSLQHSLSSSSRCGAGTILRDRSGRPSGTPNRTRRADTVARTQTAPCIHG